MKRNTLRLDEKSFSAKAQLQWTPSREPPLSNFSCCVSAKERTNCPKYMISLEIQLKVAEKSSFGKKEILLSETGGQQQQQQQSSSSSGRSSRHSAAARLSGQVGGSGSRPAKTTSKVLSREKWGKSPQKSTKKSAQTKKFSKKY